MLLYHSTSADNRASILRDGLLTEKDNTGYGAIFLSDKPSGTPTSDIWVVDITNLRLEEDTTTTQDEREYGCW